MLALSCTLAHKSGSKLWKNTCTLTLILFIPWLSVLECQVQSSVPSPISAAGLAAKWFLLKYSWFDVTHPPLDLRLSEQDEVDEACLKTLGNVVVLRYGHLGFELVHSVMGSSGDM